MTSGPAHPQDRFCAGHRIDPSGTDPGAADADNAADAGAPASGATAFHPSNPDPLAEWDATETAEAIRTQAVSPVEVVSAALLRLGEANAVLGAFTTSLEEEARRSAVRAEKAVLAGQGLGALHGVPISIKDALWLRGAPATNGCVALRDFVPAESAASVQALTDAGAIVVGKTTNPEFCFRGTTQNPIHGLTRNPWRLDRTAGGSSGGAGASVAAGVTPLTLGSDGGGSIRIPAAFCGIAGIKPTFGTVADRPGFPGWPTLTAHGPMTRTVRDLRLALGVLGGMTGTPQRPRRAAFSADLGFASLVPRVRAAFCDAIRALDAAGWVLNEAAPQTSDGSRLWTRIAVIEGHAAHRWTLAEHEEVLTADSIELIRAGEGASAAEYLDLQEDRARYTDVWDAFLEKYELLITPTMQLTAFPVGRVSPTDIGGIPIDPFFDDWCAFCVPASLTGQPAVSVPCGVDDIGLPIGLQFMARRYHDGLALDAAAAWEELRRK